MIAITTFCLAVSAAASINPASAASISMKTQVPGYTKTDVLEDGAFWFSWSLDKTSNTLKVAYQVAADKVDAQGSWAALGFSANGEMIGSQAAIFSIGTDGPAFKLYDLDSGYTVAPAADQAQFFVGEKPSMEGKAVFEGTERFTYKFELDYSKLKPGLFEASADTFILYAYGVGHLAYHEEHKGVKSINLASGKAVAVVDKRLNFIISHGFLMLFGWGLCIPAGITSARFFKRHDPLWFYAHVGGNIVGLLLATVGFVIALLKLDVFAGVPTGSSLSNIHGIIGITVMAAGWLQPFLGLIRPHNSKPLQPARKIWNLVHWGIGKAATILAFVNIIIGIHVARIMATDSTSLDVINALIYIFLLGFGVLWIFILESMKYM